MQHSSPIPARCRAIRKAPTGVQGLDGIIDGGLFRRLKDKGQTAVITAGRGDQILAVPTVVGLDLIPRA